MLRGMLVMASLAAMLGGCKTVVEQPSARLGHAALRYDDGSPAGTAQLIGQGDRLDIAVALTGLAEGSHGLRLLATGDCSDPAVGEGSDFAPGGVLHDAMVNTSGNANVSATLPGTQADVLARIFDSDGTTIVVQAAPGDDTACGTFSRG